MNKDDDDDDGCEILLKRGGMTSARDTRFFRLPFLFSQREDNMYVMIRVSFTSL